MSRCPVCQSPVPREGARCPRCGHRPSPGVSPWGFLLVAVLLIVTAVLAAYNTLQLRRAQEWVNHTRLVLEAIEGVVGSVKEAESGARGFVIAGEPEYLEPYNRVTAGLPAQIVAAQQLVADNSAQVERMSQLKALVQARMDRLQTAIDRRRATPDLPAVVTGQGKRDMDQIREIASRMENEERALLDTRQQNTRLTYLAALATSVVSMLVGLALVWLVFEVVRRAAAARERWTFTLAEERERYRVTLSSIGDAVLVTDAKGTVTYMNAVAQALTGWREDGVGQPVTTVFRIVNEHTREPVEGPVARVLREGAIVGLANHTILIGRDGHERPIDDSGAPVRTGDGTIAGVVLVFRDVEERRGSERALEDSERRYRALIDVSPQAVWTADSDGRWTFVNPWWTELTGLSSEESSGEGWTRAIAPASRERALAAWTAARAGSDSYEVEVPVVRAADQSLRWLLFQAHRTGPESGAPPGWTGVAIDMHDAHTARESLAHGLERQRLVSERLRRLAAAAVTINASHSLDSLLHVLVEEARTIIPSHQSLGAVTTTGNWDDAISATSFSDRYGTFRSVKMRPAGLTVYSDCLTKAIRLNEDQRVAQAGWKRYADAQLPGPPRRGYLCAPLVTRGGATMGVIELSDRLDGDFDEDDEATLVQLAGVGSVAIENSRLFEALHEADQRKDEFLAMLAHELRNPLAPIRNSLYLLQVKAGNDPALEQTAQLMARQVEHMARLVDDLLDVSRITRGKIALTLEPTDVGTILSRAVEASQPNIDARHQSLTLSPPETPLQVNVDLTRIAQVVTNLLNNAAKFTPEHGHITLTAARDGGSVSIAVTDDGEGIAPAALQTIFDLFVQSDRAVDSTHGGLGIGLTLVKRLTEMHGGTVTAYSEGQGRGSRFVVRLPLEARKPEAPRVAAPAVSSASPLRVLVVDDNRDSTDSLAMLLGALGHQVRTAYDGRQALALLEAEPSDLVILDIGLPGMSGYDVVRTIRETPSMASVVAVALTGYGSDDDRKRAVAAGFDHHLVKPVDLGRLQQLVDRAARA